MTATTLANEGCEGCPIYSQAELKRMGVNVEGADYLVALAGNPNTGKSTVFNALTGLRQHVGNWPGKTVVRAEGGFSFDEQKFRLVDLPGTYSLLSTSQDEEVARDFILFGSPDVVIVVVDATRLERNLNLVLQILEITDRVVVALNLMDEAERHGIQVDERQLARELGVPVVPMVARSMQGVPELLGAVSQVAKGEFRSHPHRIQVKDRAVDQVLDSLAAEVQQAYPQLPNARWVALRLLEGDSSIEAALEEGRLGDLQRGASYAPITVLQPAEPAR